MITGTLALDIIAVYVRDCYAEAGRARPDDDTIAAIIAEAWFTVGGPLTIRKLAPFVRRWLRPWQDVQAIIEEAAADAA